MTSAPSSGLVTIRVGGAVIWSLMPPAPLQTLEPVRPATQTPAPAGPARTTSKRATWDAGRPARQLAAREPRWPPETRDYRPRRAGETAEASQPRQSATPGSLGPKEPMGYTRLSLDQSNSPGVVFKHYLALVRAEEVKEYWQI